MKVSEVSPVSRRITNMLSWPLGSTVDVLQKTRQFKMPKNLNSVWNRSCVLLLWNFSWLVHIFGGENGSLHEWTSDWIYEFKNENFLLTLLCLELPDQSSCWSSSVFDGCIQCRLYTMMMQISTLRAAAEWKALNDRDWLIDWLRKKEKQQQNPNNNYDSPSLEEKTAFCILFQ